MRRHATAPRRLPRRDGYLDELVPEGDETDTPLTARLARTTGKSLALALARWRDLTRRLEVPSARAAEARIGGALAGLDRAEREDLLASGAVRAWLAALEDAVRAGEAAVAASRAPRGSASWTTLMDRMSSLGALSSTAPRGFLPDSFPRRAAEVVSKEIARLDRSLGPTVGRASASRAGKEPRVRRGKGPDRSGVERFAERVPAALALLRSAWPEAERMVLARMHTVVPIDDPGVVSFSSAQEPGVAYVSVRSHPLVRLAEDLLHEATHMRIHEIEALHPLVRSRRDGGEEPRFYSPWRREWRPIRGLLHGACTFTVGAAFFERMLAASEPGDGRTFSPSRRLWLARRFLEEMADVALAIETLKTAGRQRLLRPAGSRIGRTVFLARERLVPSAAAWERRLGATAAGREELRRLADRAKRLLEKPTRWGF